VNIEEARNRFTALERKLLTDEANAAALRDLLDTRLTARSRALQEAETALLARQLFEVITERKREQVRAKIEDLVTYGVQSVFGDHLHFRIEQKSSRNQVAFEYRIVTAVGDDQHVTDLRGHHGGGLVALVGFLLRVVMVLFSSPQRRRIIFLDETMAALDGDKRQPFARLMVELGTKLDLQFVLITHSPEYLEDADVAYEARQVSGRTTFVRTD
jgi:DNA repair exonuclease SbcCD ATPase subunit